MMQIIPAVESAVQRAARIIREGGVIIYPTDTVYGLGCNPEDCYAARRVCTIKERTQKPLPLACSNLAAARKIVEFTPFASKIASIFWPGPLMLVLPSKVKYPVWVTAKASTLGIRIPNHPVANKLARLSGGVIVSTSANKSRQLPPTTAREAAEQIGEEVDLIIDGGPAPLSQPSTVLDLTGVKPKILRVGPISEQEIMKYS